MFYKKKNYAFLIEWLNEMRGIFNLLGIKDVSDQQDQNSTDGRGAYSRKCTFKAP